MVSRISDQVWKDLSKDLEYKFPANSLYIMFNENRHDWRAKLEKILGVDMYKEKPIRDNICSPDTDNSSSSETNIPIQKLFKITISFHTFTKIKPITVSYKDKKSGYRAYDILQPGIWTDTINDIFLKEHKLPCNFIYKRGKVCRDILNSQYYIWFCGKCKDCENEIEGWADKEPNCGEPLTLNFLTNDTRGTEMNHETKRPLKGLKRKEIGEELLSGIGSNWRRKNVSDLEFGRTSPPNLYSLNTLSKAKQQFKDKSLGITVKCPISSLVELKRNSTHSGSIHNIGSDPFFVYYWSSHQLIIYKDLIKNYCRISIDATGSLVKKIMRTSLNIPSNNIFLYEAVVNTSYGQIPITQMVSESHDTTSIFNWLDKWNKTVTLSPHEAVCDFSLPILGAMSRAFCEGMTLKDYIETCYTYLTKSHCNLPHCYIRVDVAHMIKIFCRIQCLNGTNKYLKVFYVSCLRLLLVSKTIKEFREILIHLLTVSLSETDGWINDSTIPNASEKSRIYLVNLIKDLSIDNEIQNVSSDVIVEENEMNDLKENYDSDFDECSNKIGLFLENILSISKNYSKQRGNRLSAHFLPEITNDILRLSKHFPLWSSVMQSYFNSPYDIATSASVEGDFKELKCRILRYEHKSMTADRFVINHLNSIDSNTKLFRSSQIRANEKEKLMLSSTHSHVIDIQNDIPFLNMSGKSIKYPPNPSKLISTIDYSSSDKMFDNNNCNNEQFTTSDNKSQKNTEDTLDDESLSSTSNETYENWRGLGGETQISINDKPKRQRLTKYMQGNKDIENSFINRKMRSNLNSLLINGNLSTIVKIKSKKYLLNNTCAFDAVAVILSRAYKDNLAYTQFVDNSSNSFLLFCKAVACRGANKNIAKDRVNIIKTIFSEDLGVSGVNVINAECNVTYIVSNLLQDLPSANEHVTCNNTNCVDADKLKYCRTIILNNKELENISNIEKLLLNYVEETCYSCPKPSCKGKISAWKTLNQHLFIETDQIKEKKKFSMTDIPEKLTVNKEK